MVTALRHGTWTDEERFKKTCIKEKRKGGGMHQPFYCTWVADFMLRQDAGKFMLGKYLSDTKIPWKRRRRLGMAVAGTYANSQFSNQSRQDAISRVSAVQNSAERPEVRALTVQRMKHTVASTVQAAKGWQRHLRLPTTPSGGTCMTACILYKSPRASSSLSRLTKKVTRARCGDEKSF